MELRDHAAVAVFGGIFAHSATEITPKNVKKIAAIAWNAAEAFVKARPETTESKVEFEMSEVKDPALKAALLDLINNLEKLND